MVLNKTLNQKKINNSVVKIINNSIIPDIILPYNKNIHKKTSGAGFFINDKGYIITASHVVTESIELWVKISSEGQKIFKAEIICIYPAFDIAIIKIINYKNTYYLNMGNSDKLHLRETVYTIGYPNSTKYPIVTSGTISGSRDDYIQTDTPVNPGNSGGPLLDSNNNVVGITSARIKKSENSSLIVPINILKSNYKYMINNKHQIMYKNVLGLVYNNGSITYNRLNKLPRGINSGMIVKKIINNSPLYKKINEGDIILELIDNKNTYKFDNFGETVVSWEYGKVSIDKIIKRYVPNKKITIKFWSMRDKKIKKIAVRLTTFEKIYPIRNIAPPIFLPDYDIFGGLVFVNLTLDHLADKKFMNLVHIVQNDKIYKEQLVITHIFPNSIISEYNTITAPSLVKSINNIPVCNVKDLRKVLIKSLKNKDKFISIKTHSNDIAVLNLKDTVNQEPKLSKLYKYPVSNILKI